MGAMLRGGSATHLFSFVLYFSLVQKGTSTQEKRREPTQRRVGPILLQRREIDTSPLVVDAEERGSIACCESHSSAEVEPVVHLEHS